MVTTNNNNNYISNHDFLEALKAYKIVKDAAKAAGTPIPKVPDYIAQCFLDIATNLAKKTNFSGYSFVKDMIIDAVENSLKYISSFNPEHPDRRGGPANCFSYFTLLIERAFIRRIKLEKKQDRIKEHYWEVFCNPTFEDLANSDESYMPTPPQAPVEEGRDRNPPRADKRPSRIIRESEDGSKILQTAGSKGFQVWSKGRFVAFVATEGEALLLYDA